MNLIVYWNHIFQTRSMMCQNQIIENLRVVSLLERLTEVITSSVLVFDFFKRHYLFKRIHYSKQIGHDNQKIDELGLSYFVSLIHTEDYPIFPDTYQKALCFLESVPIAEKKDCKVIYILGLKGMTVNIIL